MRAGDGFYARTLYAASSAYPGPVVVELLEGPLAGAVATGGFERVGTRLVVRLAALELPRGGRMPVEAWGVDLRCACYGLEGDVDRHWLERVLLPSAIAFAEGFLSSRGSGRRTVVVQNGTTVVDHESRTAAQARHAAAARAVGRAGEVLLEDAPRAPTVTLPRNAELVVVFTARPEPPPAPPARPAAPADARIGTVLAPPEPAEVRDGTR